MPQYTVHIDPEPGGFLPPYEHGVYPDLESASAAVRAAELSYPESVVWVEDEEGAVVNREKLISGGKVRSVFVEGNSPDEPDDFFYETAEPTEEEIRRECPHHWQKMGDGLFHCIYGCGVRPHNPHPGEVGDSD